MESLNNIRATLDQTWFALSQENQYNNTSRFKFNSTLRVAYADIKSLSPGTSHCTVKTQNDLTRRDSPGAATAVPFPKDCFIVNREGKSQVLWCLLVTKVIIGRKFEASLTRESDGVNSRS